ncbi:MAG: ABC transporter substrate-binding protein [Betaproteobacteria bacterium]|nr:ABC transporter substrate-binding protein [Betaproteobacteria bacterium]
MLRHFRFLPLAAVLASLFALSPARAQITIGGTFTATGTNASIGIPSKNALELLPTSVAGQQIKYIALDDAGDPSLAVKNMRKLTQEDKIDVILGSTSTPTCLALADIALETKTPQICLAPIPVRNPYVFFTPQPVSLMVEGIVEHMKANGVKSVAFIGFSDGWGDLNHDTLVKLAGAAGIKVTAAERYARTDTTVSAQILKMMATNPDAVFVGAASTPAALAQQGLIERGYKGRIYHTHGILSRDFLRVGGKAAENIIAPAGPIVVRDQLPDSNPIKKVAQDFAKNYEAKFGAGSVTTFAAHSWDAYLLISQAIPVALKKGKPGTVEFRSALRDAIETAKDVVATQGIFTLSPTNHNGFDGRARVLVRIENGAFKLMP